MTREEIVFIESAHCVNCGAPLTIKPGQTVAVCGYCNSSLRVSAVAGTQPAASRMVEVPVQVVDEVKRLLVIGFKTQAVNYYQKQSGVSLAEAATAVTGMQRQMGYKPPLSRRGLILVTCLFLVSIVDFMIAISLLASGKPVWAVLLAIAALVFAGMNGFTFSSHLKATWLLWRGRFADGVILKCWQVLTYKTPPDKPSRRLVRLLLEVSLPGTPVYQAEASCFVREEVQSKFEVGSRILLKVDRHHPKNVVVSTPV
jgi:hypothetical protein